MRVAVTIIGLVLVIGLFVQSAAVASLGGLAKDDGTQTAGAIGVLMALMWVVACGLSIPLPRVSLVLFVLAGIFGFSAALAGDFPDLAYWGGASLLLAIGCFFGHRGKAKARAEQVARDAVLQQVASGFAPAPAPVAAPPVAPSDLPCPRCGEALPWPVRFCSSCGLAFGGQHATA